MVLDVNVKRRINNCRDILVGKVPDPKAQIEQITIALIYKFMDDMDKSYGGNFYFKDELKDYTWEKITDTKLTGEELFKKYTEAIEMFQTAKHFPDFFQSIFKNTYVPYKDPRTLSLFLKEISYFSYEHSEQLGDAFEYLLSIMGSQGDAGQFRTPRHIIDFIVEVMEPKVGEKILDPACGTAGFLISAYNFMKNQKPKKKLSSIEMKNIRDNLFGFDISPDMVRMAKVNMFLHGFENPEIVEFDTLSDDRDTEKWEARYDLILANPPFMTPKGGIKPHDLFSVTSNRAEVLFVDYISEHLKKSSGRAGIIVPEGIIFQNGNAYKDLREKLIKRGLYSVVSLPAGVFNPYSGVKTSILLLDKSISKKTEDILFLKINNDGLDLGAQRREVSGSNLPMALEILKNYKDNILNDSNLELGISEKTIAHIVHKDKIAEQDYNLSGDRYKEAVVYDGKWDLVELGEVCEIVSDKPPEFKGTKKYYSTGSIDKGSSNGFELVTFENKPSRANVYPNLEDVGFAVMKGTNKVIFIDENLEGSIFSTGFSFLRCNKAKILPKYLFSVVIDSKFQNIKNEFAVDGIMGGIRKSDISRIKIPLPPLEVQERIVEEIESYQNIIDGAKKVVESYKPSFKIDPEWDVVELGDVAEVKGRVGWKGYKKEDLRSSGPMVLGATHITKDGRIDLSKPVYLSEEKFEESPEIKIEQGDLIFAQRGSLGLVGLVDKKLEKATINPCVLILRPKNINSYYFNVLLNSLDVNKRIIQLNKTSAIPMITQADIKCFKIPLPPIETQKEIVAQIEEEQKLVDSNKKLIEIFEKKIKDKISEVWGENGK